MKKKIEKIGSNVHHNFNVSPEILAWSKKYHTPVDEIRQIFEESGNSIVKTLDQLRKREQAS